MIEGASKFRFGKDESDEQFNARIAENLHTIRHFIDSDYKGHRRFEKNIFFRYARRKQQRDEYGQQRLRAEIRKDTRRLLLMDAKSTLDGVCRRNFTEHIDLEEAYKHKIPFEFRHFLQYNLKDEEKAQEGYELKTSVGYKLVADWDADNAGDEMFVRFAIPDNLILDPDTPEEEVQQWFDDINEVNIEYCRKTDTGFVSEYYRISEKGLQKLPIAEDLAQVDIEVLTNENARVTAEVDELHKIEFLYSMLGSMSIVPIRSTHIEP